MGSPDWACGDWLTRCGRMQSIGEQEISVAVEIITIGTELLLGDILDSNAQYIARALRNAGIDLFWKTTVGDNPERIAEAIRLGLSRAEAVITTGGLGPTVDDPTREAVARAVDRPSRIPRRVVAGNP